MKYTFSIITAVKNGETTIKQTINSLIEQEKCDFEYIIVDGNSTDRTHDILSSFRTNIDTLIIESDNGVYDAFNKGIQHAAGNIIYFLNSGDFLFDKMVLHDISNTFQQTEADLVYGNIVYCNEYGIPERTSGRIITDDMANTGITAYHPSTFVKKCLFDKFGHFRLDYKIASDYDFLLRCFLDSNLKKVYVDRNITHFRQGGLSSTYQNYDLMLEETDRIIHHHLGITSNKASENRKNLSRFRVWLERILFKKRGLTQKLYEKGIHSISIFGTKTVAKYLLQDCQYSAIQVKCFFDNDPKIIGRTIESLPVYKTSALKIIDDVDAVITTIEGEADAEIVQSLEKLVGSRIPIISWKCLVDNYNG